jgi:hypothetical protein
VYTARPQIEAQDNEMTLFAKSYRLGCELMVRAVTDAVEGRITVVPQWTRGRLYRRKDRKPRHYHELIRKLESGFLTEYLRRRSEYDIGVRLIGDPQLLTDAEEEALARRSKC